MLCILINLFAMVGARLLSPTEVVEEWGCHDSIIRLTCSRLDSKIAVLEAIFTPNCTDLSEEECSHLDLKRLTRAYTSPNIDHHMAETEAGRRFLEQLRRAHLSEQQNDHRSVDHEDSSIIHDPIFSLKAKRNSLRASLEQLIVQYLNGLSEPADSEFSDNYLEYSRKRRSSDNESAIDDNVDKVIDKEENEVNYDDEDDNDNDETDDDDDDEKFPKRIVIGVRNITVPESEYEGYVDKIDRYEHILLGRKKSLCPIRRRRVTQLNQYEMTLSIQNESTLEHNIRRVLNYRCSGKNHCSFVFAVDHPFSLIWDSGSVRIKYACMENFRLNQFCRENLRIGDEITDEYSDFIINDEPEPMVKGEPIAEARISGDQNFYHHVKILKPSGSEQLPISSASNQETKQKGSRQRNQKVFSQDFRVLKILPSDLDDIKHTDDDGNNELYIKKDKLTPTHFPKLSTKKIQIILPDTALNEVIQPTERNDNIFDHNFNTNFDDGERDKSSSTIQTTMSLNILTANESSSSLSSTTTTKLFNPIKHIEIIENITTTKLQRNRIEQLSIGNNLTQDLSNETIDLYNFTKIPSLLTPDSRTTPTQTKPYTFREFTTDAPDLDLEESDNDFSVITSSYNNNKDDNDDISDYNMSYEDYAIEYNGRTVTRKNKFRTHTSHQMKSTQQPLMQGFLASVGYPKFYIGEAECGWTIYAESDQKILLTLLDINLRYDPICKDFLEIIDLEVGRLLFNSCTEYPKPLQILSDSGKVQVTVKTTSKVAYPKRGVLIHYTTFGCTLLPSPLNGRLIHRTEESAKYICDPLFVFPDTAVSSRELICTEKRTWDKTLPNCIAKSLATGPGAITVSQFNHSKDSHKMSDNNQSDMLYDVVIPSFIIAGLFIVNAVVFLIIMRYRSKRKQCLDNEQQELAQL